MEIGFVLQQLILATLFIYRVYLLSAFKNFMHPIKTKIQRQYLADFLFSAFHIVDILEIGCLFMKSGYFFLLFPVA